jgi:hypothetical protein
MGERRQPKIVGEIRYIQDRARGLLGYLVRYHWFQYQPEHYTQYRDATSIATTLAADHNFIYMVDGFLRSLGKEGLLRVASLGRSSESNEALKHFPLLRDCAPHTLYGEPCHWLRDDLPGDVLVKNIATASLTAAFALYLYENSRPKS